MSKGHQQQDQRCVQRVEITINGERRPQRQQSIRRMDYKRNAQLRNEDVPNCPSLHALFTELNDMKRVPSASDSLDEEDMNIDPYSLMPIDSTSTAREMSRKKHREGKDRQLSEGSSHNLSCNSDASYRTAPTTSSRFEYEFEQVPPLTSQSEILKQNVHVALGSGGTPLRRSRSNPDMHTSLMSIATARTLVAVGNVSITNYDCSSCSGEPYQDDCDCFFAIWEFLAKLVMLLTQSSNSIIDNKWLFYMLMFVLAYFCLGLLNSLCATIIANLTGWIWPPLHFFLLSTAGFAWRIADWLSWIDELGRSILCDMAAHYCRRYKLLCDRQCSFVDRTMESAHAGRCCY